MGNGHRAHGERARVRAVREAVRPHFNGATTRDLDQHALRVIQQ
jgi:hypothetical protein